MSSKPGTATAAASCLAGGGMMGALMRSHDWQATPVGPVERWPQSLRTVLSILLGSGYPMYVAWGPKFTQFYNDAYRPILGTTKHPAALGQSAPECFPEIWDFIGPMFRRALETGEATTASDQMLPLDRNGYIEECYFTFSYSPVREESGSAGGVLVTLIETTQRVLAERRLNTLVDLAARTAEAKEAGQACRLALAALSANPHDIPFSLFYLIDSSEQTAHLVCATALEAGAPAAPAVLELSGADQPWPVAGALEASGLQVVADVDRRFAALPGGPWPESPRCAVVLPIASPGQKGLTGFMIAGVSGRQVFDHNYRLFFEMVADRIATAIGNARAYQEERLRAEALTAMDRAKTAFFSNVSHELRTPLTLLLAPVEDALSKEPEQQALSGDGLRLLYRNGQRLLKLANTLLDFAKLEAGRSEASLGATPYMEEALQWLRSDPPPGVTDLTYFPVAEREPRPEACARILVADDNADMREYLQRVLGERYDVHSTVDGRSALENVREHQPDLLISDVMMPDLDGLGLLRALRADPQTRAMPVIMLSPASTAVAGFEGMEADDYLVKPFSARELLARVEGRLELARARRQADHALSESESRFRRLFEANIFAFFFARFDGRILDGNDAFGQMSGYTSEELRSGQVRWDQMTPEEFAEIDRQAQAELRERGRCAPFEKEFIRKDGTRVAVLIGAALLNQPFANQDSWVAFCLDLTERNRLDAQLRRTQKLESLGVLAGGVAHDFNNLLVGIMGNASLALDNMSESNSDRQLLREVVRASERAADLTSQLLAYAGKGKFRVEPIDLSSLIREIGTLIQTSIPKNVQLRLDLHDSLPSVEADSSQMQQLIMNLIINGAESIGEQHGTVLVQTDVHQVDEHYLRTTGTEQELTPGRYVYLEVRDTGCGMDEETKARIFDPFFSTKFLGRGLGLAAVVGIVRGHKGAIKVYTAPGKGSTFKVLFPAREDQTARAGLAAPQDQDLTGAGLVLVVDDEEIVRSAVKSALERYGYSVLAVENGQVATDLFRQVHDRVEMVVLDMTMPVMGGEEALRHLQAIAPEVKVVLSSGFSEVEAVRRFTGKGLAGFIQKPYTAAQLAETIKNCLSNPRVP
jgi:PAS domain S-box-containing protein